MRTTHEYTFRLSSSLPNAKLLDQKAVENGHTTSPDYYTHDYAHVDYEGHHILIGKRLTKDRKANVQITIINSYLKDIAHNNLVTKHIKLD